MADANRNKNVMSDEFSNTVIPKDSHPEVAVTVVHFLSNEVQIEQGSGSGTIDLNIGTGNDVISMSKDQAIAMAHFILDNIKGVNY